MALYHMRFCTWMAKSFLFPSKSCHSFKMSSFQCKISFLNVRISPPPNVISECRNVWRALEIICPERIPIGMRVGAKCEQQSVDRFYIENERRRKTSWLFDDQENVKSNLGFFIWSKATPYMIKHLTLVTLSL